MAALLRSLGYSLQANVKTREGGQHPDRDAQFRYLAAQVSAHRDGGDPVVSVDTNKKELVGEYRNGGREWRPAGDPEQVNVHDFIGEAGKAIPTASMTSPPTPAGSASGVTTTPPRSPWPPCAAGGRRWAQQTPRMRGVCWSAPTAAAPTATAPGCGRPSWPGWPSTPAWRSRSVTCRRGPASGTKIEHRLFAHISMNWRGRPLTSHEVVVQTIAATTTRTGLRVHAELDDGVYPKGVKVSDADMAALPLTTHDFHGEWNYTLTPPARQITTT